MYKYPYLTGISKLNNLLEVVRAVEIPKKVTYRYISSIGFSSSNDREYIPFLKMLGLIDSAGVPTVDYTRLKNPQEQQAVFSGALARVYAELFEEIPQANAVPENVLIGFFGKHTGRSMAEIRVYASTFKALVALADFSKKDVLQRPVLSSTAPITVNLNINLPITTDARVYESLFKCLKDFLAPRQ